MSSIASLLTLFAQNAAAPAVELPWHQQTWFTIVLAVVVLVVPFLVGQWLARRFRMDDYGWRIGVVLFSVVAGAAICVMGWPPRLGIDLSGGVILQYEVDPNQSEDYLETVESRIRRQVAEQFGDQGILVERSANDRIEVRLPADDADLTARVEEEIRKLDFEDLKVTVNVEARPASDGRRVLRYTAFRDSSLGGEDMDKLVGSISKRVNPGGQKEVTVRPMGDNRVEVIIPRVEGGEIDIIKRTISTAGALKFRILANRRAPAHRDLIELALESPGRQVRSGDRVLAEWVPVSPENFRGFSETMVTREREGEPVEVLVVDDDYDVLIGDQGGRLTRARPSFDTRTGRPAVSFSFDSRGSSLFGDLTRDHAPDAQTGIEYQLGVLLDDKLMTAPTLNEPIYGEGQITGQFKQQDVDILVDILNAGSLPAKLSKVPVSETTSSSQLGQDTIRAGAFAMIVSTCAILVFMVVYYGFAGFVADLAVVLNVLLVLALLILIKAHLTLAGIAGLVLSVGMSVDANVLIYERIREELARGAGLRMAIRNGFSRALSTIIDSNLTTLIVGVVLYTLGSDQLRGFATTLILGLILNLFTAVYCARVVIDIAERRRWITNLRMMKLFDRPNIDFLGYARPAIALSLILIVIGLGGAIYRGSGLFGIDFTGGTAVQIVFKEPADIAEIRRTLSSESDEFPDLSVAAVSVSGEAIENTRFNINTSNPEIGDVEARLQELFPGKLLTHTMEFRLASADAPNASPAVPAPAETSTEPADQPGAEADAGESTGAETPAEQPGDNRGAINTRRGQDLLAELDGLMLAQAETGEPGEASNTETPTAETPPASEAPMPGEAAAEQPATTEPETPETQPSEPATPATDKTPPSEPAGANAVTPAASTPAGDSAEGAQPSAIATAVTKAELTFPDGINESSLRDTLETAAQSLKLVDADFDLTSPDPDYAAGSQRPIDRWTVSTTLAPDQARTLLEAVQKELAMTPVFPSASKIGGQVAGDTQVMAAYAMVVSIIAIVIYIWVRFQNLVFGLAAVLALIHDVAITVGGLALSYWLAPYLGFLKVDQFKISLDVVAALLTIIGFSINDTIVIFDRIREVRGKSPDITAGMMNRALNETLSRTVLTSGTLFIVVIILYAIGGEGIHPFAFAMLVGVLAGTYSSLFIAPPVVLWMRKQSTRDSVRSVPASGAATPSGAGAV